MFYKKYLIILIILISLPFHGFSQSCAINSRITYANGEKGCFDDLQLSKYIDKSWGRQLSELVKKANFYSIAYSSNCSLIKIGIVNIANGRLQDPNVETDRLALSQCSEECGCAVLIRGGNVLIPKEQILSIALDNADITAVVSRAEKANIDFDKFNFEFNKNRNQSDWKTRVNNAVNTLIKEWIDGDSYKYLAEIPLPEFPPALQLNQENWESNKEFEERITLLRLRRQRESEVIQAEYKLKVSKRNTEIQKINQLRLEKEKQLPTKRRELLSSVLGQLNLQILSKSISFDQEKGFLYFDLALENEPAEKYVFKNVPQQQRKNMLTSAVPITFKPEFFVLDSGQFGIKSIILESSGTKLAGTSLPVEANKQQLHLYEKIDVTTANVPSLAQQSLLLVDKNQIEKISYRDENAELRKQLEALRNAQQISLNAENRKASVETSKLTAGSVTVNESQKEFDSQQSSTRKSPINPQIFANRKALVIGNDGYKFVNKLSNAKEDANAIAQNLSKVGYKVTLKVDQTEKEMKAVLRSFKSQVEAGDEVAIFYAGHGIQLANTNYLLPIDVAGEGEEQIKDEAISLQRILDDMSDKKVKFTLAMIDACRDNPFKGNGRSIGTAGRGLAPTSAATGQMIVFSAGTGQQALDKLGPNDKDKNGLFTRIFIKEMQKSGVTIDQLVRNVRAEVVVTAKTIGHDQVPAIYDQVVGEFYFKK